MNKGQEGLLNPARRPCRKPRPTSLILILDSLARLVALIIFQTQWPFGEADVRREETLLPSTVLVALEFETALTIIFVQVCCRWESQGHLVTMWQVVVSLSFYFVRRSLYARPEHFAAALLILLATYIVGMMTDFCQSTPPRLPPFPPKAADVERPRYGWLGHWLAQTFRTRASRLAITFVLWASYQTRCILILYFSTLTDQDDLTGDPELLDMLFLISTVVAGISLLPNALVCLASIPELSKDCWYGKKASKAYQTGGYEVCTLDDDAKDNSDLKRQLQKHECRSVTVVVPCYMPNEEEIIFDVIDYYKAQEKKYPGTMRMMIIWNSPRDHPDTEVKLKQIEQGWAALSVHRNPWSTSKCDNLNFAIDILDRPDYKTETALLNDADTMVTAETMCRASMILYDKGYDIAQSHSTHCYMDKTGQPESGCFCFGIAATLFDATKPLNMSTQGVFGHSPFNGRGGFWRVSALKLCGFDHRSIGEDHDAAYRGFACYGLKGILDQNLLCQEREPPDCKSLTSQRIRWETAALEMRRTFPWILRSKYYGKFEAFILMWSQLCWNCNLPGQSMPLQMMQLLPLAVTKSYLMKYVINVNNGELVDEPHGYPILFALLVGTIITYLAVCIVDYCFRLSVTRYRPRFLWILFGIFFVPIVMMPYMMYLQFWAMQDYCWGGAKFICTTRSPAGSPRNGSYEDLAQAASPNSGRNFSTAQHSNELKNPLLSSKYRQ